VKSFSSQTKHLQTLLAIKGISEAKVDKILEAASKLHFSSFMTGTEMLNKRKEVIKVTTGCIALDQLLGGGVETMSITEVFGTYELTSRKKQALPERKFIFACRRVQNREDAAMPHALRDYSTTHQHEWWQWQGCFYRYRRVPSSSLCLPR